MFVWKWLRFMYLIVMFLVDRLDFIKLLNISLWICILIMSLFV